MIQIHMLQTGGYGLIGAELLVRGWDTYHTVLCLNTGASLNIGLSSSYPGIRASRVNEEIV